MNIDKLQKLWNLATRNPNENEALVAARKFVAAINKEQVSVHLYKGAAPTSQQDIQNAVNKAYQKGIEDLKADYQRQLDRHLNAKYNEGYLDGQRNGYTEDDMKKQYKKGYIEGQNSKAIQKSQSSDIVQDSQVHSVGTLRTNTTNPMYLHINNGTGTVAFKLTNLQ